MSSSDSKCDLSRLETAGDDLQCGVGNGGIVKAGQGVKCTRQGCKNYLHDLCSTKLGTYFKLQRLMESHEREEDTDLFNIKVCYIHLMKERHKLVLVCVSHRNILLFLQKECKASPNGASCAECKTKWAAQQAYVKEYEEIRKAGKGKSRQSASESTSSGHGVHLRTRSTRPMAVVIDCENCSCRQLHPEQPALGFWTRR